MCKNVEWMLCAVEGRLATQYRQSGTAAPSGGEIIFSLAPSELVMKPFDEDTMTRCCGDYAENDIYYLEVCVLNEVCENSDELWRIRAGDRWRCHLSQAKYRAMQEALQQYG